MKITKSCMCRFYGVGRVLTSIFLQGHKTSILEDIEVDYHWGTTQRVQLLLRLHCGQKRMRKQGENKQVSEPEQDLTVYGTTGRGGQELLCTGLDSLIAPHSGALLGDGCPRVKNQCINIPAYSPFLRRTGPPLLCLLENPSSAGQLERLASPLHVPDPAGSSTLWLPQPRKVLVLANQFYTLFTFVTFSS